MRSSGARPHDPPRRRFVRPHADAGAWRRQCLGYRGAPVGRKVPGSRRAVMLGGSTTYGWGLPADESIAAFLERHLSATRPTVSVINLGAPAQGAFGFVHDLADFEFLDYDVVILYEGVNDLGPYVARGITNDYLWRRSSPVFRVTGYFPILPVVLRDKSMALLSPRGRAGAEGPVVFTPGLATRATAAALRTAADLGDQVSEQLGRLSDTPRRPVVDTQCIPVWKPYCAAVKDAVTLVLAKNKPVVVVTQPYISDAHVEQQANLAAMLQSLFGGDRRVRHLNLGNSIDMRDQSLAYDGRPPGRQGERHRRQADGRGRVIADGRDATGTLVHNRRIKPETIRLSASTSSSDGADLTDVVSWASSASATRSALVFHRVPWNDPSSAYRPPTLS